MIKCSVCNSEDVVGFVKTEPASFGGFRTCEYRCKLHLAVEQ